MDESKIKEFLCAWTKGVIEIGQAYSNKDDYETEALNFLSNSITPKRSGLFDSIQNIVAPELFSIPSFTV